MGRTLFLVILLLILPRVANACGCYNSATVLDDYEHADFVVIAQLKTLVKGRNRFDSSQDVKNVTMVVQRVFKGEVKIGQELTIGSGHPIVHCSWQFYPDEQIGKTYLLYLYRPEKPSEPFYVSICNRSKGAEDAHEDLLYLEKMDKLRGRTRLSGYVERAGADFENVKGQKVRIVGRNKTYIATTDEKGFYELYDLRPGRYSVEPVFQRGWMVDSWGLTRQPTRAELMNPPGLEAPAANKVWFTLRPRRHFGVYIKLRLNNKLAGRVTTSAGQPLSRVCVSLVKVNTEPLVCNDFTNADGSFEIRSVDAGSYNVVINYSGIRSSYQPFPTLYYPGVTTPDAAKVLEVKFAESIRGLNFVVPSSNETVKFEGTVRYANGRPASNRFVGFVTVKTAEFDGNAHTLTDDQGRFSLPVLKGLRGELYSSYPPRSWEDLCPDVKRILKQTGKPVIETERVKVEATENKTFELKLPISPCK